MRIFPPRSFFFLLPAVILFTFGCRQDDPAPTPPQPDAGRVLILNEGNFQQANASLHRYAPEDGQTEPAVFSNVNGRQLGDILQSMTVHEGTGYLVVNNSGKIEVVEPESIESITSIDGFTSPRFFLGINDRKAYVSDLFAGAVTVVDLQTNSITGKIPVPGWSEEMLLVGERVFVSSAGSGYLYAIDSQSDQLVDSVETGKGPGSMRLDANGRIWLLCGGETFNGIAGSLHLIDPNKLEVLQSFRFGLDDSPSDLEINADGTTLYFLYQGVRKMDFQDDTLPASALIPPAEGFFYGLGVDPLNEDLYVADARDFQQRGRMLHYDAMGQLIREAEAGYIPGDFFFLNE